jgi:hypothetical protein
VDADGQVEGFSLLVDREEVGIVQRPIPLNAAEEDATRAVLLAEA